MSAVEEGAREMGQCSVLTAALIHHHLMAGGQGRWAAIPHHVRSGAREAVSIDLIPLTCRVSSALVLLIMCQPRPNCGNKLR